MKIVIQSKPYGEHFVFFDDIDNNLLSIYKWNINKSDNKFYAVTYIDNRMIYMHRLIMDFPKNKWVDHIDGNGLNNCRNNLRYSTRLQNQRNRGKNKNNTSGFKGVVFNKQNNKWSAGLEINRKFKFGGYFNNPIDAAKRYNELAKQYFGEFAKFNEV